MKNIFTLRYFLIIGLSLLTACASSKIDVEKEDLTGQEYSKAKIVLVPIKNSKEGELILKYPRGTEQVTSIKATLKLAHEGRDYRINPHEIVSLDVDGQKQALDIVHSFKEPREEKEYNSLYINGTSIPMGRVKEVTRRKITFFLSQNSLSSIANAKKVSFDITAPLASQDYPILLEISPEDITLIREFTQQHVSPSFTKTRG